MALFNTIFTYLLLSPQPLNEVMTLFIFFAAAFSAFDKKN